MPKRIDIAELSSISPNQMDNFFNVLQDTDGNYFYDLSDTVIIDTENMSPLLFDEYTIQENDSLMRLALRFYGSYNLWWVIAVSNNIDDPFTLVTGNTLRIIKRSNLGQIITLVSETEL